MKKVNFFFKLDQAEQWCKDNGFFFNPFKSLEGGNFDYISTRVFFEILTLVEYERMYEELERFTGDQLSRIECKIPQLFLMNPKTPEKQYLTLIVEGGERYVKYVNLYNEINDKNIETSTNRQFILNAERIC